MSTIKDMSEDRDEIVTELFTDHEPSEEWLHLSAAYTAYVDEMANNPNVRVRIAPLPADWQEALSRMEEWEQKAEEIERWKREQKVLMEISTSPATRQKNIEEHEQILARLQEERAEIASAIPPNMRKVWQRLGDPEPYGVRNNDTDRIEINGPKLLGRLAAVAGSLDPARPYDRERMAVLHGVICHEVGHADFSTWNTSVVDELRKQKDGGRAVWEWVNLLEEIRMEARVVEERPNQRRWLRAAVNTLMMESLNQMDELPDRDHPKVDAARVSTLTLGRVEAGSLTVTDVEKITKAVSKVLSDEDLRALRDLWWDAIDCVDGDTAGLVDVARKIMTLTNDPETRVPASKGMNGDGEPSESDESGDGGNGKGLDIEIIITAANLDTKNAEKKAQAEGKPQPMDDPKKEDRKFNQDTKKKAQEIFHGFTFGTTTGVTKTRPATPEERRHAARLAQILTRARFRQRTRTEITSASPPGNLRTREALTEAAMEAQGLFPVVEPWKRIKRKKIEAPPLRVGLISDISGSMNMLDHLVQQMTWTFADAVRRAGGTFAGALFGDSTKPLCRVGQMLPQVPLWTSNAGSEDFSGAFDAVHGELTLFHEGALLIYITDGHLVKPGEPDRANLRLQKLIESGGHGIQVYQTKGMAIILHNKCPLVYGRPEQILTQVEKELTKQAEI